MFNYFSKVKRFELFLYTRTKKQKDEYEIDKNIKRKPIINNNLIQLILKDKLDIFIFQTYILEEMVKLNKLENVKIIFINRSCFLHWIYYKKYYFFKTVYQIYKNAKYIVSLIHFENDYLFKKWGINSILMNNFIPYEYNKITPSNLSSKTILMIGRGDDRIKRFDLGIKSMKFIIKELPDCEMIIISKLNRNNQLKNLVKNLNLENKIKFVGYKKNPQEYYRKASLHLFPTLAEAFPNILSETLIYGIPNILVGLDYVSAAKGGTVIIYDDSPLSIAKIAIKVLKDNNYKNKLSKNARKNIRKFSNQRLLRKWINLILSVYKGRDKYEKFRKADNTLNKNECLKILDNQAKLLRKRVTKFKNITIGNILNFKYMENL